MTLDHLKNIAARVNELPHGAHPYLTLGSEAPDAVEELRCLGGETRRSVHAFDRGPRVCIGASLRVDGVEFTAQTWRDATPEEAASLDGPSAWRSESKIATVSP